MRTDRAFLSSHEHHFIQNPSICGFTSGLLCSTYEFHFPLSCMRFMTPSNWRYFFFKGRYRKRSKKRQQNTSESFCNVFLPLSQDVERSKNWPQNCTPVPLKAGSRDMSMGPGQREAPSTCALGRGKEKYLLRESK